MCSQMSNGTVTLAGGKFSARTLAVPPKKAKRRPSKKRGKGSAVPATKEQERKTPREALPRVVIC